MPNWRANAQSRLDYSVYAGMNYSSITFVTFDHQPTYTIYDGPNFGFKYQLGGKIGYKLSDIWKVRTGVRIIERISPKSHSVVGLGPMKSFQRCVGGISEVVFKPKNSRLALIGGINYDLALQSSKNLPSVNTPALLSPGPNSKSLANNSFWLWSFGGEFTINRYFSIALQYEKCFTEYLVTDTYDPLFIGIRGGVHRRQPQGILLNLNYTFK